MCFRSADVRRSADIGQHVPSYPCGCVRRHTLALRRATPFVEPRSCYPGFEESSGGTGHPSSDPWQQRALSATTRAHFDAPRLQVVADLQLSLARTPRWIRRPLLGVQEKEGPGEGLGGTNPPPPPSHTHHVLWCTHLRALHSDGMCMTRGTKLFSE